MTSQDQTFDVIIIGGSYSGLSAGMALGRSLKKVLIIDDGKPCNRQTPHSHNFITHDGKTPKEISTLARQEVEKYDTVTFFNGRATTGGKAAGGFQIQTAEGDIFSAKKLIFATGVKDIMPPLPGLSECWGITVLHCPYCHGYEVRSEPTGILANGEEAFDFSALISNWTKDLTLLTNGPSTLNPDQLAKLTQHHIKVVEKAIERLEHINGRLQQVIFKDGTNLALTAIYTRVPFTQHCPVPESLGCEITTDGYIKIDAMQKTTVPGVFACGDNTTRMRTVSGAVGTGTMAGAVANREIIMETF
jgi:thioredoxin reductase